MHIQLNDVGKTYDGQQWAVKGVDLEIPSGSLFGFIGPNGAGKSTTLRMVATVMRPTAGSITLDGKAIGDDPSLARRKIGFLGDGNPLYKDMSPAEYLRFYGQCFRMTGAELEKAIDGTLEELNLVDKRDAACGELSKGMRQRVLIGRCLLHDPKLLILDEPADGLDPKGRNELRRTLQRVHQRGVTILVSSHILRELDDLCDQVAIIQQGKLVVSGEVDKLVSNYEVSRFSYEIRLLSGLEEALPILAKRQALVEGTGKEEGLDLLRVQVRGGEELMADILADLVGAGVRVVTVSRHRSRLEDVYDRLSADHVN